MSTVRLLKHNELTDYRTRVVLLGTAGGPIRLAGTQRSGIATAVYVAGSVYLVDCGEGWGAQYRQAMLGPAGFERGQDRLRGVFITHLHSDHVIDYPNLLLMAWHNGANGLRHPIRVLGPGDRGKLEPVFAPERRAKLPQVYNPARPTPGITESSQRILEGFATDINDRMRDIGKHDLSELFSINDIVLPSTTASDPDGDPSPEMEPFEIYRDENVAVTAILVDHRPVFPAFAFRFDTADGSVVISGDTSACPNLVRLARGADLLIHECIDMDWMDRTIGEKSPNPDRLLVQHMLAAHTPIDRVGAQAEAAGVGTLVLSHLVPATTPNSQWQRGAEGFSGEFYVGEDLMQFGIGISELQADVGDWA